MMRCLTTVWRTLSEIEPLETRARTEIVVFGQLNSNTVFDVSS